MSMLSMTLALSHYCYSRNNPHLHLDLEGKTAVHLHYHLEYLTDLTDGTTGMKDRLGNAIVVGDLEWGHRMGVNCCRNLIAQKMSAFLRVGLKEEDHLANLPLHNLKAGKPMLVVVLDMWTGLMVLDKWLKGKAVSTETEKAY